MTDDDPDPGADGENGPEAAESGIDTALAAGAALFNDSAFLAASDAWEPGAPASDGDDERLRRGLSTAALAAHRATEGDAPAAADRASEAVESLADLGDSRRGIAVGPVREWAQRLAADRTGSASDRTDSESVGSMRPPRVRVGDEPPTLNGLSLAAAGVAVPALTRSGEPGDPETLAAAAEFAREERGTGRTEFAELLFAYLRTPDVRPQVAARLGDHVAREERKRRDVDDLF